MNYKLLVVLIMVASCNNHNVTLKKDAEVYKELSWSEFYGIQTNERTLNEYDGQVVQMKGYFHSKPIEVKNKKALVHGKYRSTFSVSFEGGMSSDCYFNEPIQIPSFWVEHKIKGVFFYRKGFVGLKNCIVIE